MARRLNLTAPDIGTPDGDRPDGFYLDEGPGDPGTPILADLKNDIYYFFNKMMDEAGITYNNVVDTQTLSQYYNALQVTKDLIDNVSLSTSQTVSPLINTLYQSDTSSGNNSISISDGVFIGQEIVLESSGSGITFADFTGKIPVEDIAISDGYKLSLKWNGVKYIADIEVTADYTNGSWRIIKTSGGRQKLIEDVSISVAVAGFSGTSTFPEQFAVNTQTALDAYISSSYTTHGDANAHPKNFGRSSGIVPDFRTEYFYNGTTGLAATYSSAIHITYEGDY